MRDDQVAAAEEAAIDGIDFDGLRLSPAGAEYHLLIGDGEPRSVANDELGAALSAHADYVTNWYYWHAVAPQKADRWAFLRWVEHAGDLDVERRYAAMGDGKFARTWGQLRITVTIGADGERRYGLRHEADADEPETALDSHDDPLDARTLTKYDDDGQFRPLKTAPTLQTGWQFTDLSGADLVTAVDFFYPATVTNWHRERGTKRSDAPAGRAGAERHASQEGELDVSHWRETMARQTGIYGLIETWDRGEGHEHVEWVAEACCDDSQCLKRREWQYDEGTELDAPGGEGEFPCREPCSLVVAAARKWTKLESEESRTYEFDLTPSEKEQIEAIIDAVADGTADEIRDADVYDGANRYRARFLRAKLFDEDGNLSGVETGE